MSYYKKGDWNAVCDVCGFEFKSSALKKRWDGFMVCKEDFETRHPSDFIRTRPERSAIPWSRPDSHIELEEAPFYFYYATEVDRIIWFSTSTGLLLIWTND